MLPILARVPGQWEVSSAFDSVDLIIERYEEEAMSQFLTSICTLGIVLLAILVMVRVVDPGQAVKMVGKGFLFIMAALLALCMLKTVIVPAVLSALLFLQHMIAPIAIIAVLIVVLLLVARIVVSRFQNLLPARGRDHRGEP